MQPEGHSDPTLNPTAPEADAVTPDPSTATPVAPDAEAQKVEEIGGPSGPEPTRYGDWERKGRCIDF